MKYEWTPDATATLQRYLDAVRRAMPSAMDDPEEILSSLADHLTAESESKSTGIVQRDDVERAIGVVGTPAQIVSGWEGAADEPPVRAPRAPRPLPPVRRSHFRWINLKLFGIGLPAVAIAAEFVFGMMQSVYVDPMPSVQFFVLLCCVPLGSVYMLRVLRLGKLSSARERNIAFALSGALTIVTLGYTLVYLPTLPLALIGIIVMGLGILGLAPHLAFLAMARASFLLFRAFPDTDPQNCRTRAWWRRGAACTLGLAALLAARIFALEQGMQLAAKNEPGSQATAYRLLHYTGGSSYVLDRCYRQFFLDLAGQQDQGVDTSLRGVFFNRFHLATSTEARAACYLLTGDVFSQHARPWRFADRWAVAGLRSAPMAVRTDFDRGSDRVGGEVRGLTLAESRLDATLFADKAGNSGESTAYLEWVMTFSNANDTPEESRTLLHLPPGAVASRLTLWINGEEREAAFGGRDQVRAAYQEVAVVQQRDPALLTTQGPDRVLLQCFPIPARGELKVKLGVTVPLTLRDGQAYLRLPEIMERNHALSPSGKHHVWIESIAPLSTDRAELAVESTNGLHALRGELPLATESGGWTGWVATPATPLPRRYTATLSELHAGMSLDATPALSAATGPVWLVVDAGAAMRRVSIDWTAVLDAFPKGTEFHAHVAGPDTTTLTTSDNAELAAWLDDAPRYGAWQPLPALEAAWSEASAVENSRVLWIHAPYPIARPMTAALEQVLLRRPPVTPGGAPRLFDVQVSPGPNRILEALGPIRGLGVVPVVGEVTESLRYFARTGGMDDVQRTYTMDEAVPVDATEASPGSDHVVRLAAYDAVLQKLASKDAAQAKAAQTLAQRMRLVTPVSGAVVLEQKQQYERHGLNPEENQDAIAQVPAIPEPEEWALIIIAVVAMLAMMIQRRRAVQVGPS